MTPYALLTEFFPPEHGGIQASLGPLVDQLGSDVTVVTPSSGSTSERSVNRSLFSGAIWPRWWWLIGWLRQAKRDGLAIAIFGHFSSAVIASVLARRFFGLPYVVLVHGNDLLTEERRWYVRPFIGVALRQASIVGVNSAFVYDRVLRHGVAESRIIYSHPFVLARHCQARTTPKAQVRRIVTVARLVPRKNVRAVITAVSVLKEQWPDIHLDIVGDGPERIALEQQVGSLGLNQQVTFHGPVDDATKWEVLRRADVFVMAPVVRDHGTDVEGLGLVYLEAMAAGLPVVASATGGVTDAVKDQRTGLIVPVNDPEALTNAIRRIMADPAEARLLGQAGQDYVKREFTDTVRIGRLRQRLQHISTQPLVSIIIPAFQSASTIADTLRSVKAQTYRPLEIIVVNDGSTDELETVIAPFRSDLTYFRQENSGAPTARNVGFDRSRGTYVLFLDADTILEPTMVQHMVEVLETRSDASFAYSDFYFGWKKFHLLNYSSPALRRMNYIHTSSLLRRDDFPRFDPTLKKFQDWDLWLTLDEQNKHGLWIPETLFRVNPRQAGLAISTWLPSFVYRLPFIGRGRGNATVARYRAAEQVIRQKHHT